MSEPATTPATGEGSRGLLFWGCFIALIATSFGFIIRALVIDSWGDEFGLTGAQKGEIFGAGLYPFAISIILFSLVIDRIGYGTAMIFAFVCHVVSAAITIFMPGMREGDPTWSYWCLYWGTFVVALGNGTVEAVINPVVATVYSDRKTSALNALHAGWPGGLVLGGILVLVMSAQGIDDWRIKVGLILIPTVLYAIILLFCRFPVSERVSAGVSYRDMLGELGFGGAFICSFLMFMELGRVFAWPTPVVWTLIAVATIAFAIYVGFRPGKPVLLFLLLLMIPLATAELGTDSWISSLMEPAMQNIGLAGGWVLVYTSLIMTVLRFFAGPIVHKLSPLGLLAACSAIAAVGLVLLSQVEAAVTILVAATVYGVGKSFFWPTMLGIVAEQSPRGGALTLNACGGVGMLGVGVVGAVFLGYIQDRSTEMTLAEQQPELHAELVGPAEWLFGEYQALQPEKVDALEGEAAETVMAVADDGKQLALMYVALFPAIMLVGYLLLLGYFKARGGYKAEVLTEAVPEEKVDEFTGAVPAAVE